MRALVTGVAGFIGSNLARRLLDLGWDVVGVDCLTPYYDVSRKRANLDSIAHGRLTLHGTDLASDDLSALLDDVDVVFHQAAQPGVRLSWSGFDTYTVNNVVATQRLLEAVRVHPVQRLVYASSSSVYGDGVTEPCREDQVPRPFSPYGVSKLSAEHLCNAYAENFGVPSVSLRYFTVYGPGQRPDMAIQRMIESALTGTQFEVYGDGTQTREFTAVDDVVAANVAAATTDVRPGTVLNIAGGSSTSVIDLLDAVGQAAGQAVPTRWVASQPGDVSTTMADISRAHSVIGWTPAATLSETLSSQVEHTRRWLAAS